MPKIRILNSELSEMIFHFKKGSLANIVLKLLPVLSFLAPIVVLFILFPDSFETAKMKGIVLPQGMGDSHKVMVQFRGGEEQHLRGFVLRNEKEKL